MKKYTLTLIIALISSIAFAQDGIKFTKVSWETILEKAQNEKKNIFLDCYTSWCGPCKKMAANVFTLKEVGDYFNPNFVSVQMDMEKGEGVELAEKFNVIAFPTLIIFNNKGEELHRVVGAKSKEQLLLEVKKIKGGKTYAYYRAKYDAGNRTEEFLKEYMGILKSSFRKDELSKVAEDYLLLIGSEKWENAESWKMISSYLNDKTGNSPIIRYVQNNKHTYIDLYGQKAVTNKLYKVFAGTAKTFSTEKDEKVSVDYDAFRVYISELQKINVRKVERMKINANMYYALETENWETYLAYIDYEIEAMGKNISSNDLLWFAYQIEIHCDDKNIRKEASKWCEIGLKVVKSERLRTGLQKNYNLLIAD
ncbi:thioredoxin family protein [Ancylomarina sp. 16SWW S1-10-2]|uniref:thioredoxin family protein n=1 Tax=Ancylomarina sp. 16SWW S1-10-2 TaxID=2499681 RepID=UPI00189D9A50|nr:thioredoxin family protein [Ancylomarina sp. 16SWW S1-10-2]